MNHPNAKSQKQNQVKHPQHTRSKKKKITERQLDNAIEMTFPASDPVAVTQPRPDQEPTEKEKY